MAVRHDSDPRSLLAARRREAAKPGRHKATGRGSGLTPKVRKAVEVIVYGLDGAEIGTMKEAAVAAGLSDKALQAAFKKPAVLAHFRYLVQLRQELLKAPAVATMEGIMSDAKLKDTPAGAKVRLDAAKAVLQEPASSQVNVQVNVDGQHVTPGYVIDLSHREEWLEERRRLAQADGTIPVEEVFEHPPQPMREIPEEN